MRSGKPLHPALKSAAQSAGIGFGRLTAHLRVLPTLLIVGAQRSGTTSMYRALSQHPAVLKAVLHKGVHFFDVGYARGPLWYGAHFPLGMTERRVQARTGVRPVTLESSPYYMFHPLAPGRIARDLPGVRVIALLRDPVERASSAYAHELARGFETEPFERALELEQSRLQGEVARMAADETYHSHAYRHNAYVTRGQYVEQLENLARLLGRNRVHVVDSQEFFDHPGPVYAETLDFLGLPSIGDPVFDKHNARPRSPMSPALRRRLDEHFRCYDERLAQWWGKAPSWRA
ncbi:MAG: sulfotransferase family protein [Frankiaceae bacterium]